MKRISLYILITMLFMVSLPTSSFAYGWGFSKNSNHQPPDVGEYGPILEQNDAYYLDKSGDKEVYLTFDNGYEEGYTGQVLDVLKEKKVPATFFVTGHYVESSPELVKRMVDEGHIVGNHSYYHPDLTNVSKDRMKRELDSLAEAVADVSDQKSMQYLRPPRGTFNEKTIQRANDLGYTHMFWSIAFVDWHTNKQGGWQKAYHSVINQIHPGAVILLHTVSQDNAEALSYLIDDLRKQGYTFKSLDHLVLKDKLPKAIYGL